MKFLINNINTTWKTFIDNAFDQSYLKNIDAKLCAIRPLVLPHANNIFKAFSFFDVCDTKLVIFGQDPYHSENVADGLAFSSQQTKIPPSLKNLFKKLELDLGIKRINPNLSDWAQQGVLLLNTTLTVSIHEPNSHQKWGWMQFVIETINYLNKHTDSVIFLLLGNSAQTLTKYIDQTKHFIMVRPHPSPLARNKIFDKDLFKELDALIVAKKFYHMKW